jgi:probable HAF family extracellular repeat protein
MFEKGDETRMAHETKEAGSRRTYRKKRPDGATLYERICLQSSRLFLVLRSLGLACAVCFAGAAFAQNSFQITRIPTAEGFNRVALGINNKGDVVGYRYQGEDQQAFLYSSSDKSLTEVGSFGGKTNAACAINDAGQVTGLSQYGGELRAFVFSGKLPITSLGTLEGTSSSEAFGINNSGAIVGDSRSGMQSHRPVLFSNGLVQDLGVGKSNEPDALETAYAINDAGQIVGRRSVSRDAFRAFVFGDGNTTDIPTLGGKNGEALAINKDGLVVGDSETAEGSAHAFVFDHSQLKDLGTLPGFENASYARGINKDGDIVGESDSADRKRAFLYTKGQLVELDKLAENLSETGFSSLDVAYGVNDDGWIIGYGTTSDNLSAAFIAVPETKKETLEETPRPKDQKHVPGSNKASASNKADIGVFYSKLSSDQGSWVDVANYGYCFRPRVSRGWGPYRDGHWISTDYGWYWDSNESFAWATYHYGRWIDIRPTGWCWVPGNQWAPAWVSWRESDQDIGWAPLPPEAVFYTEPSISSWSDASYAIGPAVYAFISYSHWQEPSYAPYIVPPERNVQIIGQTKNVTNMVIDNQVIKNFGPTVSTVSAKTNQNIQQVKLTLIPTTDPGASYGHALQGDQLRVVAPPATLKLLATQAPIVQDRIDHPQIEKGWYGVNPQYAEKLRKTISDQDPPPKYLNKSTLFVNPQSGIEQHPARSQGATSSGASASGPKFPPNLIRTSLSGTSEGSQAGPRGKPLKTQSGLSTPGHDPQNTTITEKTKRTKQGMKTQSPTSENTQGHHRVVHTPVSGPQSKVLHPQPTNIHPSPPPHPQPHPTVNNPRQKNRPRPK